MQEYVYWILQCKTPNCTASIAVKYAGPYSGQPIYPLPDPMPGWFDIQCGECGTTHRYKRHDLATVKVSDPPPPTWVDKI
jgi:hypothetical protein